MDKQSMESQENIQVIEEDTKSPSPKKDRKSIKAPPTLNHNLSKGRSSIKGSGGHLNMDLHVELKVISEEVKLIKNEQETQKEES